MRVNQLQFSKSSFMKGNYFIKSHLCSCQVGPDAKEGGICGFSQKGEQAGQTQREKGQADYQNETRNVIYQ